MVIGTQIINYGMRLRRDGNFNLYTRFQANRSLRMSVSVASVHSKHSSYDLLDSLARRVQVNETLVNLEFVTVPGL